MTDLHRVETIFDAAMKAPASERDDVIAALAAGDAKLADQVRRLITSHGQAERFLETPVARVGAVDDLTGPTLEDETGMRVGAYQLVERIGAGGMGSVYLAERADAEYQTRVAVKLIRRGMDTEEILWRFRTERQVLANLDHPNIARLLDGGATPDGRPFLVMELVDGLPIDTYVRDRSIEERLTLFRQICAAVQFAHQNLVIHRDLKPSNVLVTPEGVVKLLDFGIAKVLGPERGTAAVTEADRRVLTPRYASPEQIKGRAVTTASDVYSLGVMLYELLTGRGPYRVEEGTRDAYERAACEQDPVRPSTAVGLGGDAPGAVVDTKLLRRRLSGDLDTIVLKAMRKEPDRRYMSVQELSEDIRRHLSGQTVLARPDSLAYRTTKFVRRNAIGVGAAALVLTLLVSSSVVVFFMYLEAVAQRESAQQVSRLMQDMFESVNPATAQGRDVSLIREIMERSSRHIETQLGADPVVAAEMHLTIGVISMSIGDYSEAKDHLEKARKLRTRLYGKRDPRVAEVLNQLGRLYRYTSRYDEGEAILREALVIWRARFGEVHRDVAASLHNLAVLLQSSGGYDESERSYQRALEILREVGDEKTPAYADVLGDLGELLTWRNRLDEAEGPIRGALAIDRSVHGEHHPDIVGSQVNLARWLMRMNRFDEARPVLNDAMSICDEMLDDTHPMRLQVLGEFGDYYADIGDENKAIEVYEEVLRLQEKIYEDPNQELGTSANNLGGHLRDVGRLEEAEQYFIDAARMYGEVLGEDHYWCSIVDLNLARLYLLMGACDRVGPLVEEAIRVRRLHPESGRWPINEAESVAAGCLVASGEFGEAEEILLRAESAISEEAGADHWARRRVVAQIVDLYESWGRADEAETWRRDLSP